MKTIFCEYIPKDIEKDTLYISEEFGCSIHTCGCGCGSKIAISIAPYWSDGWTMTKHDDGTVSFDHSLQHRGGCCSHYYIKKSDFVWC